MARKKQVAPKLPRDLRVDTDGTTTFHTYGEGVIHVFEVDEATKETRKWTIMPDKFRTYLGVITRAEEIAVAHIDACCRMTPADERKLSESFYRGFDKSRNDTTTDK
jgi:hypothetical protein